MPTARQVFRHAPRPRQAQREIEDRFFSELRMPNGIYKTTAAGRLTELDELIVRHVCPRSEIAVLDIGVASGITTLELASRLSTTGCTFRIVAADRYLNAKIVRLAPRVDVLLSEDGDALQFSCGDWARPLPQGISRWRGALLKFGLDTIAMLATRWNSDSEHIALVTADLRNHDAIELMEQDLQQFQPLWVGQFDVIRAANLLNLSYFGLEQLERMVGYMARYLKDEGLVAICRSDELTNTQHGSIFVKDALGGSMRCIDHLGDGSEISEVVLKMRLP